MENTTTYESIDALRRRESRIEWEESKRFKEDCARLAKDNPDVADWLEGDGRGLA